MSSIQVDEIAGGLTIREKLCGVHQQPERMSRMSHIVQIEPRVHDPAAVTAACRRLGLADPVHGTAQLFSGQATGLILKHANWPYPAVIYTPAGQIKHGH